LDGYLRGLHLRDRWAPSSGNIHPLNPTNQTFVHNRLMIDHSFQTAFQAIMKFR
jgi:hypothetical protein